MTPIHDDENKTVIASPEITKIVDLRDVPNYRDAVIDQNYQEWAATIDMDRDTMANLFAMDKPCGELPITLLAILDEDYLGCISLRDGPLGMQKYPQAYHPDKPWISNLWVAEAARRQKLATRLINAAEKVARGLGFEQLYISTFVTDSLYDRLGYEEVSSSLLKDKPLRSLRKCL